MRTAIACRVLQFRAGPESHRFYACEQHAAQLEKDWPIDLFFSTDRDPVEPVDEADEMDCDFCREG